MTSLGDSRPVARWQPGVRVRPYVEGEPVSTLPHTAPVVASHADLGKPAVGELDPWFIEEMGRVMSYGKIKYPDDPDGTPNWWKGGNYRGFIASIVRHGLAMLRGEDNDACPTVSGDRALVLGQCNGQSADYCPEHSRLLHAAHVAVDAMFLANWVRNKVGFDNRFRS